MNNLPRVLHCAETIKGGIATYLRELIPLQCKTFGVSNVLVLIPESQKIELPVPAGVRVETYADTGGRTKNALRLAFLALSIARQEHVSIVHVHSSFAGVSVRLLMSLGYRVPQVIYCAHGWAWDRPMSALGKLVARKVERLLAVVTDRIVCISDHERRTAIAAGISPSKLVVVRNAVSAHAPVAEGDAPIWPDAKLRVLFVGRLDRQKGVDVLLSALALLNDEVHAVVAGTSVLADGKALTMSANVTHIGWLTPGQLETLFASAQVLVIPSRWEGFGLIAVEAMRAGLPVIASRVGGLQEVVEHGVTGILLPPESPTALADVIRNLNNETLQKMGEAGRNRVAQEFTMERLHRQLCDVYGAVL